MKYDREYIQLLDFFVRLVESMKGSPLDRETVWLGDTQHVAAKLLLHLGSLFYLTRGTRLPRLADHEISYIDYPSVIVLARASYETYLAFNFIFVSAPTKEERKFRHKVWELGAFLDRQRFPATEEESIKKLKTEKEMLNLLRQEIVSDVNYFSLDSNRQKEARSGNWRLGYSWADLAQFAGLVKEEFQSTYRFLCSYAHTGNLSTFQMSQGADLETQTDMTETWQGLALGIMAHFVYDYIKVYPHTAELFKQFPEAEETAYIYDWLWSASA